MANSTAMHNTLISLREYVDIRVDARDERVVGADQSWIKIGLIASILVNFVMIFYYMSGKGH